MVASIHAEVPDDVSIAEMHAEIDELEHRIADELGVDLLIHVTPYRPLETTVSASRSRSITSSRR